MAAYKEQAKKDWYRLSSPARFLLDVLARRPIKTLRAWDETARIKPPRSVPLSTPPTWNETLELIFRHLTAIIDPPIPAFLPELVKMRPALFTAKKLKKLRKAWPGFYRGLEWLEGKDLKKATYRRLATLQPIRSFQDTINIQEHLPRASFQLNDHLELVPTSYRNEVPALWAAAAFLLQDLVKHLDRLKQCRHTEDGKKCPFLFWDQSKNKVRKFCDEPSCRMSRNRENVKQSRKRNPKGGARHGTKRR